MNKKELFNEEREIPGRQKVVCRSNVPVLTPHAGLNPRSKHVLSLTASLAELRAGCEPERQVIKANSQNGVTMYIDKSLNAVVDMDVEDWVREIEFNSDVEMSDSNKKFPNVEKLIIGPAVDEININNETFSGVKYVDSKNTHYVSGRYLVYASSYRVILENVFSPDENDVIDMSGINKIASYAFHGCKCTNLINLKTTFTWPDIEESAFVGSAFEAQPFVNGVKMVNYIVIDIDKDADKVILPDTMTQQAIFLQDIDLGVVKEMVIHNPNSISNLQYNSNLPEKLTLEIDYYIRPEDILMLPQTKTKKAKCIRKLSIKSPHYVEIDGIIYTKDMHRLIVSSAGLKHVEIPEGVEKITDFAFYNSEIESVKLPDSIKKIGDEAFSNCHNLKEVNLGNGVKQLGNYVFSWDENLTKIELPPSLQEVGAYSFYKSNIKSITLNEGLSNIIQGAFAGTYIEKVYIPGSVKKICDEAFSTCHNLKEINFGDGVQQLGNYVFSWNEKLTKIELPPSLQEVGGYAFYKSNIKSITLNEGLSNIVQGAFVGTHIEKLYIPGSVKHIGKGAISENTKEIIMPVFLEDILQGIRRTEKINHFDHTSHIVRLQCGDKYAYLPRYVDISKFADLTKTVTDFFTDFCEERPELWKYAEDTIDKEDLAMLEYYDFNAKEAKEYLKRNAKIFALRLIQNKDEERLAKLLKMNIASNQLLKLLLEEAGEMPTARAYILEMLGNTKTRKYKNKQIFFYLNVIPVQNAPVFFCCYADELPKKAKTSF